MALNLSNLDAKTRKHMLEEIERDSTQGKLYQSPRLTPQGAQRYPTILREAVQCGDDSSFANALREPGILKQKEERKKPSGGTISADVPITAPETLAEGEFNRFYARGLCLRAIEENAKELEVYRAKSVMNPRPESEAMIGKRLDAQALLADLRASTGVEPALGLPPGPNSGLSVKLPSS